MPILPSATRKAGLEKLDRFAPNAGQTYARGRNFDRREDGGSATSELSPYLRHRLISEEETVQCVLEQHTAAEAEKFIQEIFWRTYWKGWLEMRPQAWSDYRSELNGAINRVQSEAGLRRQYDAACLGKTELDYFNFWSHTIVNNGYLHNHARMWFASIWIFTLQLPWALGADFFMRHLLDGDAASNTLSWRWVAGLQTRGKTYLATADNIERFTSGRFRPSVQMLAPTAPPLPSSDHPAPSPIRAPDPALDGVATGLLLHDDDLLGGDGAWLSPDWPVAALLTTSLRSPLMMSTSVGEFSEAAAKDALERCGGGALFAETEKAVEWALQHSLDQIITPYAPIGPTRTAIEQLERELSPHGITLARRMRPYDSLCWPHATKGFFPFKAHIPDFLNKIK